jgi:tetratricopeptide (TPR) repeat protein
MQGVLPVLQAVIASAALATAPVQEAERLAAEALRLAPGEPARALEQSRRALRLTGDFDPTSFVSAGRKGEVVEDVYQVARVAYRRHRAGLYEAVGEALLKGGQALPAERYLRRAVDLDPGGQRVGRLARALLAQGKGGEVLGLLQARAGLGGFGPEALGLVEQAVDAARAPSAQVEVDRARLREVQGGALEFRDGPFRLPPGARLSTGGPARLDGAAVTVVYLASVSCRTCSADLEALKRIAPAGTRIVLVTEKPDEDRALRQVLDLYRYEWPMVLGSGVPGVLGIKTGQLLVVGRQGWAGVVVDAPYVSLPAVMALLNRRDVVETVPRKEWNGRPVERRPLSPGPPILPGGLAPGEDAPPPPEFERAVEAYRGKKFTEALRLFEELEARGDGWLLPPEARIDRALCLSGLGRREEARRLLLRTGDSRFLDAADQALEGLPR